MLTNQFQRFLGKGYKYPMEPSQVQYALTALEYLDQIKGQARNHRLQVLSKNSNNPVLLEIFRLTYDWRVELGIVPIGLVPKPESTGTLSIEQSWLELQALVVETQSGGGFLANRKKLSKFFDCANPMVSKWAQRIISRDLQIYLSIQMLNKVWGNSVFVPFIVPPRPEERVDGGRAFIFIQNHRPVTYTDRFRKFAFANDAFARQIARGCENGVIEGWVTSSDWPLTQSLLSHHVSTLSKTGFKSIFYGIRFEAISYYHSDEFFSGSFKPDVEKLDAIIKGLNPRTSISVRRDVYPYPTP